MKLRLRGRAKLVVPPAPGKLNAAGVQGVMGQDKAHPLLLGQTPFDQSEVAIRIAPVKFIAHQGMAKVLKVDADLVFAAGQGLQPQERE